MPYTNDDAYAEGWNDAMKEAEVEIAELKKENKDYTHAYGDDQMKIANLQTDIEQLETDISELQENIDDFKYEIAHNEAHQEEQTKKIDELTEQRDTVINLSEMTIREIKQKYQEKIDDIADFAKELQNDYKKHIKEIEELKKENEKMKKKWGRLLCEKMIDDGYESDSDEEK